MGFPYFLYILLALTLVPDVCSQTDGRTLQQVLVALGDHGDRIYSLEHLMDDLNTGLASFRTTIANLVDDNTLLKAKIQVHVCFIAQQIIENCVCLDIQRLIFYTFHCGIISNLLFIQSVLSLLKRSKVQDRWYCD